MHSKFYETVVTYITMARPAACWMSDMQLVDLQLPNRITTTDYGMQFLPSK